MKRSDKKQSKNTQQKACYSRAVQAAQINLEPVCHLCLIVCIFGYPCMYNQRKGHVPGDSHYLSSMEPVWKKAGVLNICVELRLLSPSS